MARAQDQTDEFNEKSPFELKFYADTVEIDIQEGIPNDVAKLNVKVLPKLNFGVKKLIWGIHKSIFGAPVKNE